MAKDYDEEERVARIDGEPTHFSQTIIKSYNPKRHCVSPEDFPIDDYEYIVQAVDPHDGRPSACTYRAKMKNGRSIFFSETPTDSLQRFWKMKRTQDIEDEVVDWVKIENYFTFSDSDVKRVLDKNFGWQTRGGNTISKLYLDAGKKHNKTIIFSPSYKSNTKDNEITFGHDVMESMFKNTLEDGYPEVVIWNTCYHTLEGMKKYIKKRPTTQSEMAKAVGGTVIVEKYKDFPDSVRYSLCAKFESAEKERENEEYLKDYVPCNYNKINGKRGII
jgi:hypothetical protein